MRTGTERRQVRSESLSPQGTHGHIPIRVHMCEVGAPGNTAITGESPSEPRCRCRDADALTKTVEQKERNKRCSAAAADGADDKLDEGESAWGVENEVEVLNAEETDKHEDAARYGTDDDGQVKDFWNHFPRVWNLLCHMDHAVEGRETVSSLNQACKPNYSVRPASPIDPCSEREACGLEVQLGFGSNRDE